jgi:hypothetical protein
VADQREGNNKDDTSGLPPALRRPYAPPELVEYGTVAKLTQGVGGSGTDFSMMMMLCL